MHITCLLITLIIRLLWTTLQKSPTFQSETNFLLPSSPEGLLWSLQEVGLLVVRVSLLRFLEGGFYHITSLHSFSWSGFISISNPLAPHICGRNNFLITFSKIFSQVFHTVIFKMINVNGATSSLKANNKIFSKRSQSLDMLIFLCSSWNGSKNISGTAISRVSFSSETIIVFKQTKSNSPFKAKLSI